MSILILTFFLIPFVPDEKIIRLKLLVFELGVFLSVFSIVALGLKGNGWTVPRSPLLFSAGCYTVMTLLFWGWAPDRTFAAVELRRILLCFGACLACALAVRDEISLKRILWAWSLGAWVACFYAGLQRLGGLGPVMVPQMDRVMSTFGNPIFFSAFALMSFFVTLALFFLEGEGLRRQAIGLILGFEMMGLFLAQTRASWIGWTAGVIVLALGWGNRPKALKVLGVVLLGVAVSAFVSRRMWFRDQAHLLIWRDTLKMWMASPWTGIGLGRFHIEFPQYAGADLKSKWPQNQFVVNYAHNEYLQTLSETGLLGFLSLAAVIVALGIFTARLLKKDSKSGRAGTFKLALVSGAAAILVQEFFSVDFRFVISSAYLFSLLGLLAGQETVSVQWPAPLSLGGKVAGWAILLLSFGIVVPAGGNAHGLYLAGLVRLYSENGEFRTQFLPRTVAPGLLPRLLKPYLAEKRVSSMPDFFDSKVLDAAKTIADLESLVKQYPKEPLVAERLAYVYAKEIKRPDGSVDPIMAEKALTAYRQLLVLDPARMSAYNNMGNINYTLGRIEPALQSWREAVKINPGFLDAQLNLGKVLFSLGRLKESSEHLKAVLQIDPHNDEAVIYLKRMVE